MIGYIFHMWRTLYANLIGRIAFFTGENIAHIEFCVQGLLPKILAIYTIKYFTWLGKYKVQKCLSEALNRFDKPENER